MPRCDKQMSDRVLLSAYRSGDLHAWDILVERYEALICAVPRRMGLSPSDVEDVGQNVFIALLNQCDRLRDEERLAAWLVTVARREAWQFVQRQRRRRAMEISPDPPERMESVVETEEDALPEEALLALEEQHLVRTALAQMPDRCRLMLSLLYIADPPAIYTAVAARLQMPVGSVGPQRARCLEKLKKKLAEIGY